MKTIAINDMTLAEETVIVDGRGHVPRGYHAPTNGERWFSLVVSLREEIARYEARGDVVLAEQARRTLSEM